MKGFIFKFKLILVLCFMIICLGCSSSENDMKNAGDNDDNNSEIKTSSKDNEDEIKSDLSKKNNDNGSQKNENSSADSKITDNKFSEVVLKTYAIQLGAFSDESNAQAFMEKAKQVLKMPGIYYKNVDGIFKIRIGNFNSLDETFSIHTKISSEGFTDTFITDLSRESK